MRLLTISQIKHFQQQLGLLKSKVESLNTSMNNYLEEQLWPFKPDLRLKRIKVSKGIELDDVREKDLKFDKELTSLVLHQLVYNAVKHSDKNREVMIVC